jgi:hypothetical protein
MALRGRKSDGFLHYGGGKRPEGTPPTAVVTPPTARGLDYDKHRAVATDITAVTKAKSQVSRVTGLPAAKITEAVKAIDDHASDGRLKDYFLDNPKEIQAGLCMDTNKTVGLLLDMLDGPDTAHLQALKNLLLADFTPPSTEGAYLDTYNAVAELLCASFRFLESCKGVGQVGTGQDGNCHVLKSRAENMYNVIKDCLQKNYEFEKPAQTSGNAAPITAASMKTYRKPKPIR